jgi:hypothetical protein
MSKLSRRTLVASAATLPALAVPAFASPYPVNDPIFAAIKKYQTSDAAFLARCGYEDEALASGHKLALSPDGYRTPEMVAVGTASRAARAELANTSPTTLSGLATYLDFVVSESAEIGDLVFEGPNEYSDADEQQDFVRSLQRAVRQIARHAVQS